MLFSQMFLCIGQGNLGGSAPAQPEPREEGCSEGLGHPPWVSFLTGHWVGTWSSTTPHTTRCETGHCPWFPGPLVTLACPITFAPGLEFLKDWLQSLIDPANSTWAGDVVKGGGQLFLVRTISLEADWLPWVVVPGENSP